MPRVKISSPGGGGSVSNVPYGLSWAGVTAVAPSKNAVYNEIQLIGYVPGNIAYQNAIGGDDSTAVLGNQLRPFRTIGAAIAALGYLTNALLICSAGVNNIYDADCPQGLKPLNSTFDIYLNTGCTINYYGTYGVFISNTGTGGSIFGNGIINNYSAVATGIVDGISGYSINIAGANAPYNLKKIQADRLINNAAIHLIRVGDCVTYNSNVSFISNGLSIIVAVNAGVKNTITLDTNSKTQFLGYNNGGYIGNALVGTGLVIKANNPANFTFDRCSIYSHGNQFGANMPVAVEIKADASIDLKFTNSEIKFAGSSAGYSLITLKNTITDYTTLLLDSCRIRSRAANIYPAAGYSITSDNNLNIKIIDTYATMDINPVKTITNVISTGNQLMVEANL